MLERRVGLRRAYDLSAPFQGKRVLVDRVWPRGVSRDELQPDLWLRDLAPSTELRKWFNHRPDRWEEFRHRYRTELASGPARRALEELVSLAHREPVVLLFGARDVTHNQAVVIRELVEERLGG